MTIPRTEAPQIKSEDELFNRCQHSEYSTFKGGVVCWHQCFIWLWYLSHIFGLFLTNVYHQFKVPGQGTTAFFGSFKNILRKERDLVDCQIGPTYGLNLFRLEEPICWDFPPLEPWNCGSVQHRIPAGRKWHAGAEAHDLCDAGEDFRIDETHGWIPSTWEKWTQTQFNLFLLSPNCL